MKRIPKQSYAAEFKEQAVKRAEAVGSIARVAEEHGLIEDAALLLLAQGREGWQAQSCWRQADHPGADGTVAP